MDPEEQARLGIDKTDYSDWSKEDFIKEIKKLKKRKKYGIVWDEEKTKEKFDKESEEKLPVLKEIKNKEIITKDEFTKNILIEGDNYHTLSVLNYTHKNSIDLIYIDPPYNTGKEFRYNDKLVDYEDTYRHSKWLSYINKRLKLARNLLTKKGVIFISIDDHEFGNLKLLCNEIFGEENFLETIIWKKRATAPNDREIGRNHEYILCYTRSDNYDLTLLPRTEESDKEYTNPDNDPRGRWRASDLSASGKGGRLTQSTIFPIKNSFNDKEYMPPKNKCWLYNKKKIEGFIEDGRISFRKNGKPFLKRFLNEVRAGLTAPTIWTDVGFSQDSAQEIKDLFGGETVFENPKPLKLMRRICHLATKNKPNSITLDFFAGSGTTGHAILEMNEEDGGNRKFILCTNNEDNICTDVCYPRIQNSIKGYTNTKNEKVKGLGGNLKYFKTDFVDGEPTDKNKKKLVEQCTEILCLKEDCFDELKQTKNYSVFKNHQERYIGIIYDDDGIEPLKKQIKSMGKKFNVYVFSLDDSAREEEFEDVIDMVDLKPIPEVILNVYRRIFK